ncbi:hypothetical protein [Hymenobacter profundi]|nr:hypothetical protein [Hymenobacter profundi]
MRFKGSETRRSRAGRAFKTAFLAGQRAFGPAMDAGERNHRARA